MRPGNKPAHKACANVCLLGGVPPVFITTTPLLGTRYLLMGDAEGHALPDAFRDSVAVTRRMDGTLERIGDALVSAGRCHAGRRAMIWRSTAQILVSFLLAGLAVVFGPVPLDGLGLGEFTFVGQVCAAILVLSVLEAVFRRIPDNHATEPTA